MMSDRIDARQPKSDLDLEARPASFSEIELTQLMLPDQTNPYGNVHGAWLMKLADEAGGLAAMRHSGLRVVTKVLDHMTFDAPVHVGDVVHAHGRLTWTGRTSMETKVTIETENPRTGERRQTNTAWLVFVAIDRNENPHPVPALLLETEEDRIEWKAAERRREQRLQSR